MESKKAILLYQPDLTQGGEQAVLSQMAVAPFRDKGGVTRWEAAWSDLWERSAVIFADHQEAMRGLKKILGWSSGDVIGVDLGVDPVWHEALEGAWLHAGVRDVDGVTGQGVGECQRPETNGLVQGMLVQHAFGLPTPMPVGQGLLLEEISAVVHPMTGCGAGGIQLVNLTGPRVLPIGMGCVVMSRDQALMEALAGQRLRLPSGLACALGISQLSGLQDRLQRRQELAHRYLGMRLHGEAFLPVNPVGGRAWESFCLTLANEQTKESLATFLKEAAIGCGSPLWFAPRGEMLPGMKQFLANTLALPLYASLSDANCKRIINRVHRWVARQPY